MIGRRVVFIIPGFRHKPTSKGYQSIAKILRAEGYQPVPIAIPWKRSTISDNTAFFLKKYQLVIQKNPPVAKNTYLLGFSYGAMIALLAATKISIKGLILCSLSPYFREDLPKLLPKNISLLQEKRYADFKTFHFNTLAKKIRTKKLMMLYGTQEAKPLIRRVKSAFTKIASPKKYLFSIQQSEHVIADKKYLHALTHVAKNVL